MWLRQNGSSAEARGVSAVLETLAKSSKGSESKVHVLDLSTMQACAMLKESKASVTASCSVVSLTHNADQVSPGCTHLKVNPPIRREAHVEALWDGLLDGTISAVSSGHRHCSDAEKGAGDWNRAAPGADTLKILLPALWGSATMREVEVERMADWLCFGPARAGNVFPAKGVIAVGADADLVIWDPEHHDGTTFHGARMQGRVLRTIYKGERVFCR